MNFFSKIIISAHKFFHKRHLDKHFRYQLDGLEYSALDNVQKRRARPSVRMCAYNISSVCVKHCQNGIKILVCDVFIVTVYNVIEDRIIYHLELTSRIGKINVVRTVSVLEVDHDVTELAIPFPDLFVAEKVSV